MRKAREEQEVLRDKMREKREEITEAAEAAVEAERLERAEADVEVVDEILEVDSEKIIEEERKTLDNLKENIFVFFRNYTSAIGQLKPEDRIAVLINLNDWEMTDNENAFLTAWITREDVNRYRRNQVNASDFRKLIHYQLADSETDIDLDISILSEIFDRAMNTSTFWGKPSNNGIYINGLGALLFMDLPQLNVTGLGVEDIFMLAGTGKNKTVVVSPTKKGKTEKDYLKEVEDELFELVASYGHTLRLKPQERIVLDINLGSRSLYYSGNKKDPSRLIFQLKKKDLDDYNSGIISLRALRGKLVRQIY